MKIEQAIYGEVRSGHGLRLSSDGGRISTELTARLDLPDTAPPGTVWSPFLSGFRYGDHYVIARTFADTTATRPGMVLSHAVIAPLDAIVSMSDLRPLLALLIATPEPPEILESCVVSASVGRAPEARDLLSAAAALTERGKSPVVRIGTQGFEELVASLWFHFWPELRSNFAFRLSFSPQDIVEEPKPALVCTPTNLAIRWTGHRLIETETPATASRATAILSSGVGAKPVLDFAREIGAPLDTFSGLHRLLQAYELATLEMPKFDECISTVRIVDLLSPNIEAGIEKKRKLLESLTSRLSGASVREVLLLRNLSAAGFSGMNTLWSGLESWTVTNSFAEVDDQDMLSVFDDALSPSSAILAWQDAIIGGVKEAIQLKSSPFSGAFWRWAHARPETLANLMERLPGSRDIESSLCEAVPNKLSDHAAQTARALALSKGWLQLHGSAVAANLSPRNAVVQQLKIDADPKCLEGVKASLGRATPQETIAIALDLGEPRVMRFAAEEAARKPNLLKDIDFSRASAKTLWTNALTINSEAWKGPADPHGSFSAMIDVMLEGGPCNMELIAALARTPVADLSDHPRRRAVWESISQPVRANLLKATAAGWVERAVTGHLVDSPEPKLEAAILDVKDFDHQLHALAKNDVLSAIGIVAKLTNYDEARFVIWLDTLLSVQSSFAVKDIEALGRLVLRRRWKQVIDLLIQSARKGRNDVKQALRICKDIIGIWDTLTLGLSSITNDEKWRLLEELATELYPRGPDENSLWDRAGGQDSDLQIRGNGKSRWHDAILQLRRGKGPRMQRVLGEMSIDYPANDRVRYLAGDSYFSSSYR